MCGAQLAVGGGDPNQVFDDNAPKHLPRTHVHSFWINQLCDTALILASLGGVDRHLAASWGRKSALARSASSGPMDAMRPIDAAETGQNQRVVAQLIDHRGMPSVARGKCFARQLVRRNQVRVATNHGELRRTYAAVSRHRAIPSNNGPPGAG